MDSITCKGCGTQNSGDSKFCKMCGAQVLDTKPMSAEEKHTLVDEGFTLVQQGKLEEASFIAKSVLDADADFSKAHSLLGMIHEERGDLVAALSAYEQVVRLHPESTIDRIKIGQIKRRLDSEPLTPELEVRGRNWIAIASGVAAALAVTSLGVVLALPKPTEDKPAEETVYASNTAAQGFVLPSNPPTNTNTPNVNPQPQPQPDPNRAPSNPVVRNPMGSLPPLEINPSSVPTNTGSRGPLPNVNEAPTAASPANTTTSNATPQDPNVLETKRNPGRIVITESKAGTPVNTSDPNVSDNIYRVAQQKMATGDYRGAIRDFTAALAGTRRPGMVHQLIGRCYARIGDAANARTHFEKALAIYEQAGAENEAKACKRELELLG